MGLRRCQPRRSRHAHGVRVEVRHEGQGQSGRSAAGAREVAPPAAAAAAPIAALPSDLCGCTSGSEQPRGLGEIFANVGCIFAVEHHQRPRARGGHFVAPVREQGGNFVSAIAAFSSKLASKAKPGRFIAVNHRCLEPGRWCSAPRVWEGSNLKPAAAAVSFAATAAAGVVVVGEKAEKRARWHVVGPVGG